MPASLRARISFGILLSISGALAEPVSVRYTEGVVHGFLELQTLDGKLLASGESIQTARGDRVTSHLIIRFKDGSVYEETTLFSQRGSFRLLHDHVIQKGPAFKESSDTTVDAEKGQVTVRYTDKDGKEKLKSEHRELPNDLANGLLFTLAKDIVATTPKTSLAMVVTTPKPRLVGLEITSVGSDSISVGLLRKKATHFVGKIKIGGLAGAVAPIVGKQPPDIHIWVLAGDAPAFLKYEGPLEQDGPVWRIQMAHPPVFERNR